jgi:ADP-ribosyl-[dinitrogen reductase] hydrolase
LSHTGTRSALDPATIDRAVGAVLASAAGDALGAPYEFDAPDPNAPCELEGGGHFGWEPGEWTDDTQMALAVLAVLAEGDADPEAIGTEMVRWYASGPRDVGNQTRAVLGDAARHGSSPRAAAETFQQRRPDAAGNGALMRTGPVALAALGDRGAVARLSTAVAELTHSHPDSVEACALWSLAIERAIITARPDRPFDWVAAVAAGLDHVATGRRDLWRTRIDEAAGRDPIDFHHNNGWVVAAFQAALAAITATANDAQALPCDHLTAALRRAARAGGDTDTVAAIAGSLLGARWGATAVPLAWRRRLHGRRIYGEPALTAADLDAMARLAVGHGHPDGNGWPGAAHLDYGPMPSRFVELDGAWFGNVGGIGDAVHGGSTVVVSLCRMGTSDVPDTVEHHTVGLIDTNAADNPNAAFVLLDTARAVGELAEAGERVFTHCVQAEHRAPSMAAAYLITRGADAETAIARARDALGGAPSPFLRDALVEVERIVSIGH